MTISAADRAAICRLDVEWAKDQMFRRTGTRFHDSHTETTGAPMTADENALYALHRMRLLVGNKRQARASRGWINRLGLPLGFR